jgi:hypothetical protein
MKKRCPFCWDRNVRSISQAGKKGSNERADLLMYCPDCEKWYWDESGTEVSRLFMICETSIVNSEKCYKEIREILSSGFNSFPPRRLVEFNHLCSECPSRNLKHFKIFSARLSGRSSFPHKFNAHGSGLTSLKI